MAKHYKNYIKLLYIYTVCVSLGVLRLAIEPQSGYERIYMYPNIPLYIEHIIAGLVILVIGYIGLRYSIEIKGSK